MPRKPLLTDDEHLHDMTPEHVYRVHHAQDPHTGETLRGVTEPAQDECGCAHCVAHVEQDESVLTDAKAAWSEKAARVKSSKQRK